MPPVDLCAHFAGIQIFQAFRVAISRDEIYKFCGESLNLGACTCGCVYEFTVIGAKHPALSCSSTHVLLPFGHWTIVQSAMVALLRAVPSLTYYRYSQYQWQW